jgi:nitrogen PTS system EIIA component
MELSIKDMVELLQVSEKTIRKWVENKEIPAYKIDNGYRFNKAEISEWILKTGIHVSNKILDMNLTNSPRSIHELILQGGIYYDIPGSTVPEVIGNSVAVISCPPEVGRESITSSLLEREELMPTAIGAGIAIPHARNPIIADIDSERIAVCFLQKPIDYRAIDGLPVGVVFILLSANAKRHLEILAKLMYLCRQQDFIALLRERAGAEKLLAYVARTEAGWAERTAR